MPAKSHTAIPRKIAIAAALYIVGCYLASCAAQTPNAPAGQTSGSQGTGLQGTGLQGTGPRVDVQNSANGTLDVGGAGGDVNLMGENFRGSFGASRLQPGWSVTPAPPRSSFQTPFAAPNFNPSLPGPLAPRDADSRQADEADLAEYPDLILPRFRSALSNSSVGGAEHSRGERSRGEMSPADTRADAWRYRFFNGRWWFWQPGESWLYWDGSRWQAFAPRP